MPRHDRIARLPPPPRDRSFAAWPVVLDLGGTATAEAERSVRLRFLVLRVARRLLDRRPEAVPAASLARQIDALEAELDLLPADDPERAGLARLLAAARRRSARALARAVLDVGERATERGDAHAGAEYCLTAAALAASSGAAREEARSLGVLARAYRKLDRDADAAAAERRAADAEARASARRGAGAAPPAVGRESP